MGKSFSPNIPGADSLPSASTDQCPVFGTLNNSTAITATISGMNKPGDVDPRYLVSVSESLLVFLPGPVRRYISSLGPQFMQDKYKVSYYFAQFVCINYLFKEK
ncbi:hypothetical protein ElyMa_005120700 [Elysia marginata]|uniref:Uncharacterized protein n=1 Tax=Elysia marginata TaxID=1093978 RepID=A0AAV4JQQ7_9GAST|nr:hypothetical protein ElyMa_005120700 [Elysia marginata]